MANPHLPAGAPSPTKFGIDVHLETGIALKDVSSPSHGIDVAYASATIADVKLRDQPGATAGNRDFVLRYRLAGDKIESGLLLSPRGPDGDGYFALMMEPPQRPKLEQIPPREYIFLLDVSGSMHGFPLDTAKALMRELLGRLRPTDHFDLALFSGANYVMSPGGSVPATAKNVREAIDLVERQNGGGGTELMGGLRATYAIPRTSRAVSRSVVVVTDGYVGVEAEAFRFVRERLDEANLFAFGIGSSVNRALIEGLARAGRGEPFVVLKPEKAAASAERLRTYIEQPVLSHVGVAFEGLRVSEISPPKLPDLLARRPLVLFGKYQGEPTGQVRVTGFGGGGAPWSSSVPVRASEAHARNEALRWLWARSWVATLEDERAMGGGQIVEDAITDLGLRHNLLTAFTSFVAVDHEVVNRTGESTSVRQPLPMPEGVSNLAVASAAPASAPAPAQPMMRMMGAGSAGGGLGGLGARGYGTGQTGRSFAKKSKGADAASALDMLSEQGVAAAPSRASEAPKERAAKAEREDDRKDASTLRATVVSLTPTDVAAPQTLRAAIEARLATLTFTRGTPAGLVALRLSIDASGKVTGVDVLSGDAAVAAQLRARLLELRSAAKATSPKATVVVTIRLGR
jgi:Ca-activated chloride channel family protein